jgi:selenocysteine lyase/cysteine desulfurase
VLSPWGKGERSGIVSLKVPDPKFVHRKLLTEKIVTAVRGNALRLSPHFYNSQAEIQQFFETLEKLTTRK